MAQGAGMSDEVMILTVEVAQLELDRIVQRLEWQYDMVIHAVKDL